MRDREHATVLVLPPFSSVFPFFASPAGLRVDFRDKRPLPGGSVCLVFNFLTAVSHAITGCYDEKVENQALGFQLCWFSTFVSHGVQDHKVVAMDDLLVRQRAEQFGDLLGTQTLDALGIRGGVISKAARELGPGGVT